MSDALFYAITIPGGWIALYLLLPLFVKPKWKDLQGMANGRNGMFLIHVDPNAPHKLAVVAHEWAEWWFKYKRPWMWFRWRGDSASRQVNLWGPAVETAAAVLMYPVDESAFIRKEANTLARRDYFGDDWPQDRIEREITRRMPEAREWVADNLDKIKKYK